MRRTETPYSTKEVTAHLSIGDSTLRKWCLALEEQNYNFIRTDQNKRLFTDQDLIVLARFKLLVQDKNMSINNAAAVVASKYVKEPFSNETEEEQLPILPFSSGTLEELRTELTQGYRTEVELLTEVFRAGLVNIKETHRTEIEQLKEENRNEVEQLKEMNRMLFTRLDEQHSYIESRFNATDQRFEEREKLLEGEGKNRDQLLMQSIRESQETKKLLLEMKEQLHQQEQRKKPRKGLLKWFSKE